ncbi:MAG: T9SS type A sorting domain-containing protein [Ignavibacteriales bacterium]|nr:T9SS type A sorting domain-containing protein [Ignavibacteriales bacterium]
MKINYSNKNIRRAVILLPLCLMLLLNFALSQNAKITWSSFNMGFAKSQTTNTMVSSVVGQNFVGTSIQGNTEVVSGFLADTLFRGTVVAVKENEELPAKYSLEQNYPNPFNPSTTVQFSIVNTQLTVLKVYDVLGKEVVTLINEVKPPGAYTVRWDAVGYPSGVYYYRLQAGNFIETKKLILMK